MAEHTCINSEIIHKLDKELAVAQSDIKQVKSDISDIKQSIAKFNWWFITMLATMVGGMATIIMEVSK